MFANRGLFFMFAGAAAVAAFILAKTGDWVWGYFAKPNDLILNVGSISLALAIAVGLYRNERVFALATEVTNELKKVTWPTRQETQMATLVVIVTVVIASGILGLFDAIWSWVTTLIYG
jgi:preprotein translocase subunit SecE